jgi:uncharacterized membrane protein YedE/YeeE
MNALMAFAAGVAFGVGLLLSGMTDPGKVIGFLDLAGAWDPSLAFVMGGAVLGRRAAFAAAARYRSPAGGRQRGIRHWLGPRRLLSRPGTGVIRVTPGQCGSFRRGDAGRHAGLYGGRALIHEPRRARQSG